MQHASPSTPRKLRVYVAGPYTQGDKNGNVERAIGAGETLWCAGFLPYVPHLSYWWERRFPAHSYEEWLELVGAWLPYCDIVLRLPGASSGSDLEVAQAVDLGIPVYTSLLELLKDYRHDDACPENEDSE